MQPWGTLIVNEINNAKTIALSVFVAIGAIRIVLEGIKYKSGTEDERLEAKKGIRNNVIWFVAVPFALWLAMYLYGKATGIK